MGCARLHPANLQSLEETFTEQEVAKTLAQLPRDRIPGPDGFTVNFYKSCWVVIKPNIMAVFQNFHNLCIANLHLVNTSNIVLIPKKDGANRVVDYRLISLIHKVVKWISKRLRLLHCD